MIGYATVVPTLAKTMTLSGHIMMGCTLYINGFTFEILYLHTKNASLSNFGLALVACVAQSYTISL